jgi:peptidoglycan/LPS O-acetylase OafA/YrhL
MKILYRPEIDGLRAISVFSVILFHAQINIFDNQMFKGGFIGVDIFFVISGYLITSLILKEIIVNHSFSFINFYQRRARRILPVLLIVIITSMPFAWFLMHPGSIIYEAKTILSSLGFSSNIFFHVTSLAYGLNIDAVLYRPFLHTWSLSVEEQFYIIFPIVLLIIFKYFKKYILSILIFSFIVGLIISDWGSVNYASFNFYFLPTRAWEFLAGAILAYFEIKRGFRCKNNNLNQIFPIIGIILILHASIFFYDGINHPSFYTLSPIIGVCFVIWFSQQGQLMTDILSSKLFVGIGLISYSLYLWHYPIFAFSRIINETPSLLDKFVWVILTIFFSIISFFIVEKPARNKKYKFKYIFLILSGSILIISFLCYLVIIKEGYQSRFFNHENYKMSSKIYLDENLNFETTYNYDDYSENKQNILIVGNSVAEDILEIFSLTNLSNKYYFNLTSPRKRKSDYNFKVHYLYHFLRGELSEIYPKMDENFQKHLKKQYSKSKIIIIANTWYLRDIKILDKLVENIKRDGKKVVIFDMPITGKEITPQKFDILDYWIFLNKRFPDKNEINLLEKEYFNNLSNKDKLFDGLSLREKNNILYEIANKHSLEIVKRQNIFCDINQKKCPLLTPEGYKIYFDGLHITKEGALFFAKLFEENKFLFNLSNFFERSLN